MDKRLTRDPSRAVLGGVAAGLGDYLDVDPVIIRLVFVILCLAGGSGLILYVVCWLIIPRADDPVRSDSGSAPPADRLAEEMREAGERVVGNLKRSAREPGRGRIMAGGLLIALGVIFLVEQLHPIWWLNLRHLWPLLLIGVGVVILLQARDGGSRP